MTQVTGIKWECFGRSGQCCPDWDLFGGVIRQTARPTSPRRTSLPAARTLAASRLGRHTT
jgi:hypothetical protein